MKYILFIVLCMSVSGIALGQTNDKWVAPKEASKVENKFKTEDDISTGGEMFGMYCTVCHGEKGKGDGPAGTGLPIPAKDFTSEEVKKQSDGALFWKLTTGKGNMTSYESVLTEEERWQVISYIRTLGEEK